MTLDPRRLQDQLRASAARGREVLDAGALLVTIHSRDELRFLNYAVPADGASAADVAAAAPRVVELMSERGRLPRVEAVAAATPGLDAALLGAGWELESRLPIMTCPPQRVRAVPRPPGLVLQPVGPGDDPEAVHLLLRTAREAFGEHPESVGPADVAAWRSGSGRGVLARLYGIPAAAGQLTAVDRGLAEAAGIGTRVPYRRRGLAGAVTEALARAGFAAGAELVFLSPGDERTGRVYARAGFVPDGEVLALVASQANGPRAGPGRAG